MAMKINLNDTVSGVLTEYGAAIYNKRMKAYGLSLELKQPGDVIRTQLHDFIRTFGEEISFGMITVVEKAELEWSSLDDETDRHPISGFEFL